MKQNLIKGMIGVALAFVVVLMPVGFTGALAYGQSVEDNPDNVVDEQQLPDSSFIYDVAIADLANADSYFEGQTVQVTGEVVGDHISAGPGTDASYITLMALGDSYAEISVYMMDSYLHLIDTYGGYQTMGTTLKVQGTYHLVCPDHDGLSDLHADKVQVVHQGYSTHTTFDPAMFIPGIVFVVIGLLLVFFYSRMQEHLR